MDAGKPGTCCPLESSGRISGREWEQTTEGSLEPGGKAVEDPSVECPDLISMKTWLGSGPLGVLCSPPPGPPVHLSAASRPAEKDLVGSRGAISPPSPGAWDNLRHKGSQSCLSVTSSFGSHLLCLLQSPLC